MLSLLPYFIKYMGLIENKEKREIFPIGEREENMVAEKGSKKMYLNM